MSRIAHFEINADNPERAIKFYQSVFGWKFDKWEGQDDYWLIDNGSGDKDADGGGGLMTRMGDDRMINTFGVDSVDKYLGKIKIAGGQIVAPKMAIEEMGYVAYVTDSEGNKFGVFEKDESAK